MMTSPWHFAVQAPDGLHGEVRRGPRHPEASGRLDGVEGLGELPGSNVDNQQQDRDPAHDNAGDGHPLVGGTPFVCRLHAQVAHDHRRDTRKNAAAEQTGAPPQAESPGSVRLMSTVRC